MKRSNNKAQGDFFILKQVGLFAGMALLILIVDAFLYVAIALFEANASYDDGSNSPQSEGRLHISDVADSLTQDSTGAWTFDNPEAQAALEAKNAWAILIDDKGTIQWAYNTPTDFPSSFTQNEIAVISHDRAFANYVTFIWTKDSNLVMMGYPDSQYVFFGIVLSNQAFLRLPLYFLFVFTIDLLIIFFALRVLPALSS